MGEDAGGKTPDFAEGRISFPKACGVGNGGDTSVA